MQFDGALHIDLYATIICIHRCKTLQPNDYSSSTLYHVDCTMFISNDNMDEYNQTAFVYYHLTINDVHFSSAQMHVLPSYLRPIHTVYTRSLFIRLKHLYLGLKVVRRNETDPYPSSPYYNHKHVIYKWER